MTKNTHTLFEDNPVSDVESQRIASALRSSGVWIAVIWLVSIIVGFALRGGWVPALDLPILNWIHAHQVPWLQEVMRIITLGGYWPAYVVMLALLLVVLVPKKQGRTWLILALNAALTWGANNLMKVIFNRERPLDFFQIEQDGLSYPSGHAMVAVAVYLLAALMIAKAFPNLKCLAVVLGVASFLPGLSRLFMGVHYPSDVLMGWLLGVACAAFWYQIWLREGAGQ